MAEEEAPGEATEVGTGMICVVNHLDGLEKKAVVQVITNPKMDPIWVCESCKKSLLSYGWMVV